jgi:hypothetical protein
VALDGLDLGVDDLVGLAEQRATLRVPADDVGTSRRASIGAEISPVNAPSSSWWQFCAPSAIGSLSDCSSVWTDRSATNGGQTTISCPS